MTEHSQERERQRRRRKWDDLRMQLTVSQVNAVFAFVEEMLSQEAFLKETAPQLSGQIDAVAEPIAARR